MKMTDEQIREFLRRKGWPAAVYERAPAFLFQRWHQLVEAIADPERTRNWIIDDYLIFIQTRELIHQVDADKEVAADDHIFRTLVIGNEIRHSHKERTGAQDFWNFGYPRHATGFFRQQIEFHILGRITDSPR